MNLRHQGKDLQDFISNSINDFLISNEKGIKPDYLVPKEKTIQKLCNLSFYVCPETKKYLQRNYMHNPTRYESEIDTLYCSERRKIIHQNYTEKGIGSQVQHLCGDFFFITLNDVFYFYKYKEIQSITKIPNYLTQYAKEFAKKEGCFFDLVTANCNFHFTALKSSQLTSKLKAKLHEHDCYQLSVFNAIDGQFKKTSVAPNSVHKFLTKQYRNLIDNISTPNYIINQGNEELQRRIYYSDAFSNIFKDYTEEDKFHAAMNNDVRAEIIDYSRGFYTFPYVNTKIGIRDRLGIINIIKYGRDIHLSFIGNHLETLQNDYICYMRSQWNFLDLIQPKNSIMQYHWSDKMNIKEYLDFISSTDKTIQEKINLYREMIGSAIVPYKKTTDLIALMTSISNPANKNGLHSYLVRKGIDQKIAKEENNVVDFLLKLRKSNNNSF